MFWMDVLNLIIKKNMDQAWTWALKQLSDTCNLGLIKIVVEEKYENW